ncbi:MAG: hypothetical protein H0U23_09705 [Blastocatellia bacterium]|nr:hypothetical protein [Blastocatellia bacterium]
MSRSNVQKVIESRRPNSQDDPVCTANAGTLQRCRKCLALRLYINQARKIVVELTPAICSPSASWAGAPAWHLPIESAFRIAVHRTAAAAQKRGGKHRKVAS